MKLMAFWFILLFTCQTFASQMEAAMHSFKYRQGMLQVRVGVLQPAGEPVGDILYIHGFADRFDNHIPLFQTWSAAGFRVIAFDLPSHGEDSGSENNLNGFSFRDLAELAAKIEAETRPLNPRPLFLAGWSTGGLIVVRALQENWGPFRPISGAILFAPGVSVRKFPWTFGNRLGFVTDQTLTHDPHPPHVGPNKPNTPFWSSLIAAFAPRLVAESVLSQHLSYPTDIPTLVVTGGDREDVYAKEWVVRDWVNEQNKARVNSAKPLIIDLSCPHAMHELDNETPTFGGVEIKNSAAAFAQAVVLGKVDEFRTSSAFGTVCQLAPVAYANAFGNLVMSIWTLSTAYAPWFESTPRNMSDPHPWPAGFSAADSPVFAHNEIFIRRSPDVIFQKLLRAHAWSSWYPNAAGVHIAGEDPKNADAKLTPTSQFQWKTFGTVQSSAVKLFEPNVAIGWTAEGFGVQAFHRWYLFSESGGTRVVTEECDKGFTMDIAGGSALLNPSLHASHQLWLENLKSQLERSASTP